MGPRQGSVPGAGVVTVTPLVHAIVYLNQESAGRNRVWCCLPGVVGAELRVGARRAARVPPAARVGGRRRGIILINNINIHYRNSYSRNSINTSVIKNTRCAWCSVPHVRRHHCAGSEQGSAGPSGQGPSSRGGVVVVVVVVGATVAAGPGSGRRLRQRRWQRRWERTWERTWERARECGVGPELWAGRGVRRGH